MAPFILEHSKRKKKKKAKEHISTPAVLLPVAKMCNYRLNRLAGEKWSLSGGNGMLHCSNDIATTLIIRLTVVLERMCGGTRQLHALTMGIASALMHFDK